MSSEASVATQPLGELVEILSGFPFKSEAFSADPDEGTPLIRIRDIKTHAPSCSFVGDYDPTYLIGDGDIIVGMDGEFTAIRWQGAPALLNQRVLKIRSSRHELLDEDYLFHRIHSDLAHLETVISGTTVKHLSVKDIRRLEWCLPPLDEQRRIAEVLRSASAASEAAHSVVEKYGNVIKTEIDSVVAELIADSTVPVVRLGDVATVKGGKRLPKGSEYSDNPTGFRYIRVTDWNHHEIDPSNVRWISSEAASAIQRYTISSADLFISIAGSIGLVATVPSELDGAFLTENAAKIVLRGDAEIDRDYLLSVMISGSLIGQIQRQKGVGGGVPKLALFRIETLEIPLPNLNRQREIAAAYRGLKAARATAAQSSACSAGLCRKLANDLLSGRVRVPA